MAEKSPGLSRKIDANETSIPEPRTDQTVPLTKQVDNEALNQQENEQIETVHHNNVVSANQEEPGGSSISTAMVVPDITRLSEEQQQTPLTQPNGYMTVHIQDNTGQTYKDGKHTHIVLPDPEQRRSKTCEQLGTDDQHIQKEKRTDETDTMSLEKLLTLVDKQQTNVSLYSCTALLSEIHSCNKTTTLHSFLGNTVRPTDEKKTLDFPDLGCQGFSRCKMIVLGRHPFETLTWLKSAGIADDLAICLLSYLANQCKLRSQSSPDKYHELLEVDPVPASTEDLTKTFNPVLVEQCKQLYIEFRGKWEHLKTDQNLHEVITSGVCLLSICDIGLHTTGHELLPVLNKYCKHPLHIVCYDSAIHKKIQNPYELIGKQLRDELQNIGKKSLVFLAAIGDTPVDDQKAEKLTKPLKGDIGHDHVYHIWASEEGMAQAKEKLEKLVIDSSFYNSKRIAHLLLLQMIKQKSNSFWIKRSDFESYATLYNFESDEFDSILKFFTTFGSVLYIHDIVRLREYVITDIVEFVKQIDILREANKKNKKKELPNLSKDDLEVVKMFITGLNICR